MHVVWADSHEPKQLEGLLAFHSSASITLWQHRQYFAQAFYHLAVSLVDVDS